MTIPTALASSALALGVATTGLVAAAPAEAAPAPVSVSAGSSTAVAAPSIDHVLTPSNPAAQVLVVGKATPGATVEITYRGQTVTVQAGKVGTPTAGYWGDDLPGRQFGGGERTITAVQIVDGHRSTPFTYEYQGFVFPY